MMPSRLICHIAKLACLTTFPGSRYSLSLSFPTAGTSTLTSTHRNSICYATIWSRDYEISSCTRTPKPIKSARINCSNGISPYRRIEWWIPSTPMIVSTMMITSSLAMSKASSVHRLRRSSVSPWSTESLEFSQVRLSNWQLKIRFQWSHCDRHSTRRMKCSKLGR